MTPESTRPACFAPLCLAAMLTLLPAASRAEEPTPPAPAATAVADLTAALFDAESPKDFEKALADAEKGGVPRQAILEARFLHFVDLQDQAGIARLAPELTAQRGSFRLQDSHIFSFQDEWEGVVEYAQALAALEANDQEGFKKHILEAFWLSPRQAGIFAPHIEQLHLDKAMAEVRVDLQKAFAVQNKVAKASLGELAGDSPVILLHFWSPWSQECEMLLDDFVATAGALTKKGVAVVSVLADTDPETLPDANSYQTAVNNRAPSLWVIDDQEHTLTKLLRVADLPTMAVVDRAGKVHFNGHPSDKKLWQVLQKLVPGLQRPALPPKGEHPEG